MRFINAVLLTFFSLFFFLILKQRKFGIADIAYQSDYHITFPERVDGRRGKRDLSTSEKVFFKTNAFTVAETFF